MVKDLSPEKFVFLIHAQSFENDSSIIIIYI